MNQPPAHPKLHWDIFCRVIDNFGDIGVCWRLCLNLAQRGQTVRLWVDDASALAWMAPDGAPGVQVLPWTTPLNAKDLTPGDVLVEAFGCDSDPEFIAAYAESIRARGSKCLWINLEYLTAESYAARCHRLPSPV
ncbi:elongation factor P maturation arginine rhamnosyltransferase EarP, partial [Rhodoferax sp. 4810]|nr:elongation factor P maturation arginine rhamnosyltransferase EarP [Rhodoferax jenense]